MSAAPAASAGPVGPVDDIWPGPSGSRPYDFVEAGGLLYFFADDGVWGTELWTSDGSPGGTTMVADIRPGDLGSGGATPVAVGDRIFFSATDGTNGRELWVSDGTATGTHLVKDIAPGSASSAPQDLTAVGDVLYFVASDGTYGGELWRTDGSEAGTTMVKDINPGSSAFQAGSSWLTAVGDVLYFVANDGTNGFELWATDGTDAGTGALTDDGEVTGSGPVSLTAVGPTLFFVWDAAGAGELWRADGRSATRVSDDPSGAPYWNPQGLTDAGGTLYFGATDGGGTELWRSDGTAAGTARVADIRPDAASSAPGLMTAAGSFVYFFADDGSHGRELWRTDGTGAGTKLVADIITGTSGQNPSEMVAVGSRVYFQARQPTDRELWTSDGTQAGTVAVSAGDTDGGELYPRALTVVGSDLFFFNGGVDGVHGRELWKAALSSGPGPDPTGGNLSVDLTRQIGFGDTDPVFFGEPAAFEIVVTNESAEPAGDVSVDLLAPVVPWDILDAPPGCTVLTDETVQIDETSTAVHRVHCLIGDLAAGAEATRLVSVAPAPYSGAAVEWNLRADVIGTPNDDLTDDSVDLTVVPVVRTADLDVALTITEGDGVEDGEVFPGTPLTYTVETTNLGPHGARDATLTVALNDQIDDLDFDVDLPAGCTLQPSVLGRDLVQCDARPDPRHVSRTDVAVGVVRRDRPPGRCVRCHRVGGRQRSIRPGDDQRLRPVQRVRRRAPRRSVGGRWAPRCAGDPRRGEHVPLRRADRREPRPRCRPGVDAAPADRGSAGGQRRRCPARWRHGRHVRRVVARR